MASPWIDVSVTLRTGMVSWPGDPPARISHALDMERGDPCTANCPKAWNASSRPHPTFGSGRTQTNGPKDYEAVHKVQDG